MGDFLLGDSQEHLKSKIACLDRQGGLIDNHKFTSLFAIDD